MERLERAWEPFRSHSRGGDPCGRLRSILMQEWDPCGRLRSILMQEWDPCGRLSILTVVIPVSSPNSTITVPEQAAKRVIIRVGVYSRIEGGKRNYKQWLCLRVYRSDLKVYLPA